MQVGIRFPHSSIVHGLGRSTCRSATVRTGCVRDLCQSSVCALHDNFGTSRHDMPEQPSTHFKLMSNVCASTTNMSDRQNMGTKAHGMDTAEQILIELKAALLTRKWLAPVKPHTAVVNSLRQKQPWRRSKRCGSFVLFNRWTQGSAMTRIARQSIRSARPGSDCGSGLQKRVPVDRNFTYICEVMHGQILW